MNPGKHRAHHIQGICQVCSRVQVFTGCPTGTWSELMDCSLFSASKFSEIGQSRVFLWVKMKVFGLIQEVGHRRESRNLPSKSCTKMNLGKTYLSIGRLKGQYRSKSHLGDDNSSSVFYLLSHTSSVWMNCSLCLCITVPGISYHHHPRNLICLTPVMCLLFLLS